MKTCCGRAQEGWGAEGGWGKSTEWTGTGRDEGPANHYVAQLIDLFGAGDCSPEADVLPGTVLFLGA